MNLKVVCNKIWDHKTNLLVKLLEDLGVRVEGSRPPISVKETTILKHATHHGE